MPTTAPQTRTVNLLLRYQALIDEMHALSGEMADLGHERDDALWSRRALITRQATELIVQQVLSDLWEVQQ